MKEDSVNITLSNENGFDPRELILQAVSQPGEGIATTAAAAKIDFSQPLERPPVCLSVVQGYTQFPIFSLGNFSLITGKAKAKKTFFLYSLVMAFLGVIFEILKATVTKQKAIIFDTEQAMYTVQQRARIIWDDLTPEKQDYLEVYSLRKFSPSERLEIIEYVISTTEDIGLIVIDGIRDLVTSINDEAESTAIASKLLKWSEEYHIHIICVLHQNKNDSNARGHVGTELINKAETTISITKHEKDPDLSVVDFEYCRGIEPPKLGFRIVDGLPTFETVGDDSKKSERANPMTWPTDTQKQLISEAFQNSDDGLLYSELRDRVRNGIIAQGWQISRNDTQSYLAYLTQQGFISQRGKSGTRNAKYFQDEGLPF
jgi:hypothetical protein